MALMGFDEAKRHVLQALALLDFEHEARDNVAVKNLLQTGQISPQQVFDLIKRSRGHEHTCSPHHVLKEFEVHLIRTQDWYIKFYFADPRTTFISVHRQETR